MAGNQSLERGLAILTLLDAPGGGMGVRDIARKLGVSPTIVQRLVNTLSATGFVTQVSETRRYQLGYRAILLGSTMRHEDRLLSAATRELSRLASTHHLNGYLGVLRGGEAVYLDCVQSSGPVSVRNAPGSRINLHSTAIGKMLLSTLSDEDVEGLLGADPLETYTPATRRTVAAVLDDLAQVRRQGYATVQGENIEGIASAATLVRDASSAPVAALSVAFLSSEHDQREMGTVVELLLNAAYHCAQSLGYAGPAPIPVTHVSQQEEK